MTDAASTSSGPCAPTPRGSISGKATGLVCFILLPIHFLLAPAGHADSAGKATLHFANGDWLRGSLEAFDPVKGLQWRHPNSSELLQFQIRNIREITLPGNAPTPLKSTNACEIVLINGDTFKGNLVAAKPQTFSIDTWHSGRLEIPRASARKIAPLADHLKVIYEGPTGDKGWTHGEINTAGVEEPGQWRYHNGGFHAKPAASIARDLNLPSVSRISFDMAWNGTLHLAFALYTDSLQPISLSTKENEPDFGGFYSVQLNSYSVNLLPVKKHEPLKYLGQATIPDFRSKSQARIEFFCDKTKKLVAVSIDGKMIRRWIDTSGFAGQGTGVRLVHQGRGAIRISGLRVREWDGQFREQPTNPIGATTDLVKLLNGDRMQGRVESISPGRITVATQDGTLPVPLSRVKQIEPANMRPVFGNQPPNTVRAHLSDGSRLTLLLRQWHPDRMLAKGTRFGPAEFKPGAIMRLEFRPSPLIGPAAARARATSTRK